MQLFSFFRLLSGAFFCSSFVALSWRSSVVMLDLNVSSKSCCYLLFWCSRSIFSASASPLSARFVIGVQGFPRQLREHKVKCVPFWCLVLVFQSPPGPWCFLLFSYYHHPSNTKKWCGRVDTFCGSSYCTVLDCHKRPHRRRNKWLKNPFCCTVHTKTKCCRFCRGTYRTTHIVPGCCPSKRPSPHPYNHCTKHQTYLLLSVLRR